MTHIKALGPPVWGLAPVIVDMIDAGRERGVSVFTDQYPYDASSTGLSSALLPRWAQEGGPDSLRTRLADPSTLIRIQEEMVENLARRGGGRIVFASGTMNWIQLSEGDSLSEFAME